MTKKLKHAIAAGLFGILLGLGMPAIANEPKEPEEKPGGVYELKPLLVQRGGYTLKKVEENDIIKLMIKYGEADAATHKKIGDFVIEDVILIGKIYKIVNEPQGVETKAIGHVISHYHFKKVTTENEKYLNFWPELKEAADSLLTIEAFKGEINIDTSSLVYRLLEVLNDGIIKI